MRDFLVGFLSNAWVVGILGGIISGIIVYFITKWMFQRKDNSKHLEQISIANMDIIRALKPYIAEKGLPEKEIIDAIILSTARKYKVKSEELYSIRVVCEELIREIVENVYVSSDKKQEYTQQLKDYLHNLNAEKDKTILITEIEKELKANTNIDRMNYKKKFLYTLSTMMSFLAAILTMVVTLLSDQLPVMSDFTSQTEIIFIVLAVSMLTICTTLVFMSFLRLREKSNERNKANYDHSNIEGNK